MQHGETIRCAGQTGEPPYYRFRLTPDRENPQSKANRGKAKQDAIIRQSGRSFSPIALGQYYLPIISNSIAYPSSPREVSALTIVLGERCCQKPAGYEVASETAQDFSLSREDMCRVTGTSVVRPHHYYPSDNCNATSQASFPLKSSFRRSPSPKSVVFPSSQKKKTVSFAVADVTSQVSQKSEKDDMEHLSPEHNVLTTVHEAVLPPASSMSPSEKADIWWQSHDYSIFSGTARLISGEIRRRAAAMASAAAARSAGTHNGGESSSSATKAHAESYANVLAEVLEACSLAAASISITATSNPSDEENDVTDLPLNPSLFAYLAHWTRSGHSRRGLERWSVAYHGSKRSEDRERQIQVVLIAQTEFSTADDKDNKIKSASESHSRAARLFALTIGHADAAAVGTSYPS